MFTRDEYLRRVERARTKMRAEGLTALMVTGDYIHNNNYRYLTGHLPRDYQTTADRTHVLVLTLDGAAIIAHWAGLAAAKASWVETVVTYTPPFRHANLAELFRSLGVASGRVGAELGDDQRMMMPFAEYEALKAALPAVSFVDAGPLLWKLRQIKSPAEVEAIRAGDRMTMAAHREIFATLRRGMTARDVQQIAASALVAAGADRPPHSQITFTSNSRAKGPDGFILAEGDVLFIDIGVIKDGYWAEFDRMGVVGGPSPEQERWHKITRDINETWWNGVLRPGITAEDAILEHIEIMKKAGLTPAQWGEDKLMNPPYAHHAHGIGMSSSEPPRLRLTDKTVLEAGMVINVETYIQGGDTRYGCEEDAVITPSGAEVLSEADTGLFTIA
jgi:Xaa-Pro dipeptidase